MKELGEQFKDKREEIGISIEEASSDLKTDSVIIKNFEEGNDKVFKDIIELKDFASKYAKYLDLDSEKIIDDINDYLFEKTSKISVEDIEDRIKSNEQKEEKKKVITPYTRNIDKKDKNKSFIVVLIIIFILLLVFYLILRKFYLG